MHNNNTESGSNGAGKDATFDDDIVYSMTVPDAARRLRERGYPLSERTIQRYCAPHMGILDCRKLGTTTGAAFYINPASVEDHADALDKTPNFGPTTSVATDRDMSRKDATHRDETRHDATSHDKNREEPNAAEDAKARDNKIEDLQEKIFELRVDKAARDQIIKQAREEISLLWGERDHANQMIGELRSQLTLLGEGSSPRQNHPSPEFPQHTSHEQADRPRRNQPPTDVAGSAGEDTLRRTEERHADVTIPPERRDDDRHE